MSVDSQTLAEIQAAMTVLAQRERDATKHSGMTFMRVFLSHYMENEPPEFHKDMFRICLKENPAEWEGKAGAVFAAPRGHAKSTIASMAVPLFWGCHRKKKFVVLISNVDAQAEFLADALRKEFEENDQIRDAFGELRGDRFINGAYKWTNQDFTIAHTNPPGSTNIHDVVWTTRYVARGMLSKLRGLKTRNRRPDAIILDDCENDEHIKTPEQREKTWLYYAKVILPMLDPRDNTVIVVGTILHDDSLLAKLLDTKKYGSVYLQRRWQAISESGEILWPQRFSAEKLNDLRIQLGGYAFASEFQNDPIDPSTRKFRAEWVQWYTKDDLEYRDGALYFKGMPLRIYMGVDQAIEEKEDKAIDETAIVIVGATADNRIIVLYVWHDRIDFPAQVNQVKTLARQWSVAQTGIEKTVYQRALAQQILHDGWLPIRQLENTAPKYERITAMSVPFEHARVYLRAAAQDEPWNEEDQGLDELKLTRLHHNTVDLYRQLMRFPMAAHDDMPDALCNALQVATGTRGFADWF